MLTGGAGADRFTYTALSQSISGQADRITDFSRAQKDKISLSAIDANSGVAGDQAFSFIGSAAFSGAAGQLRAFTSVSETHITGDVNGDLIGDFLIRLGTVTTLQASDFIA